MNWLFDLFRKKETIPADPMKYLIAGLGNIGAKYDNTRHNIGFDVVDALAEKHGATEKLGDVATIKQRGRTFVLLKPSTYMNRSGKAVHYWMQKEKIDKNRLLVVIDDLNLDFGKIRLRGKGSDGGHNGLSDITRALGGADYARLRIGIGNDYHQGQQVDYVLGEWSSEQQAELPNIIKRAAEGCIAFGTIGLQHAMSQYNG